MISYIDGGGIFDALKLGKDLYDKIDFVVYKCYQRLIDKYGSREKAEDEMEKYWYNEFLNYSKEEFILTLKTLHNVLKDLLGDEYGDLVMAHSFVSDLLEFGHEEEVKKIESYIKEDRKLQEYFLEFILKGARYLPKSERYWFSRQIKLLYKLLGKELPKIDATRGGEFDGYEYWEKFVDEYLGVKKEEVEVDEKEFEEALKDKEIRDCMGMVYFGGSVYACKDIEEEDIQAIEDMMKQCESKLYKRYKEEGKKKAMIKKFIKEGLRRYDYIEIKELLDGLESKLKDKIKESCVKVIKGYVMRSYVIRKLRKYNRDHQEIKEKFKKDKKLQKYIEEVLKRGMENMREERSYILGCSLRELYEAVGKELGNLEEEWC